MSPTPIETGGKTVNPAIAELAALNRWVGWKTERRKGKTTKPPFCIGGRRYAKADDPATWDSFDQCWTSAYVERCLHGIGFVLGDGVIGADLDHCVQDGVVALWALEIIQKLNSYTEVSPSGTGLHVICHGEMAGPGRKVDGVEIYPRDRYFTMTGQHLDGTPDTINHVSTEVLENLLGGNGHAHEDFPGGNGPAAASFDDLPADLKSRFLEACAWDEKLEARWRGEPPQGEDQTRSAWDMSLARLLRRYGGFTLEDFAALAGVWEYGTGTDGDARQRRRAWDKAGEDEDETPAARTATDWPEPDLSVLADHRLAAPALPLDVFGPWWSRWISRQAEAKSCPPDYVAAPLLAGVGVLLGNARWGSPWPGWAEPPIVWTANIGLPSCGKSPGRDATLDVLEALEADINGDFEQRRTDWETEVAVAKIERDIWEEQVKKALKSGGVAPDKPECAPEPPTYRRLVTNDVTVEKAARLVLANPRGVLLSRDELAGWIGALDKYGGKGSDRAFYIEAYGGRRYAVDRVKDATPKPIVVPALTIGIAGGIQPDRLNTAVLCGDDDGLAARFIYVWPDPAPPRRPAVTAPEGALLKLARIYAIEGDRVILPLEETAATALQAYREQIAATEADAAGLFLSWVGKLPGMAVRLAVILEHLHWSGERASDPPPTRVSEIAAISAIAFLDAYALPMARRCFGEAALPQSERDVIALARWIIAQDPLPEMVNAPALRRHHAPIGRDAARYDVALTELAEAGWLRRVSSRSSSGRPSKDWAVNPRLRP